MHRNASCVYGQQLPGDLKATLFLFIPYRFPIRTAVSFQQAGTTRLFLMHCQIQLELTFWAWLLPSGSASVCVAEAAS